MLLFVHTGVCVESIRNTERFLLLPIDKFTLQGSVISAVTVLHCLIVYCN